ncbi:MAG TPA: universal stress protein [Pyrinomonadaceae bacterium]|nr:universal stress protein [Pyrinomonadaceae bacterium]
MNKKAKILIAYDASECADAALEDLRSAGLPKAAEALVMTMADVFLPPPINEEVDNTFPMYVPAGVKRAHERAARKLKEAESMAKQASEQIKKDFPEWQVRHEALADSPAWAIIRTADKWDADLIVVGAQGHAVLGGRLILGSVSQRVLYEARCSVRIARGRQRDGDSPLRLLIGVDNSSYSNAAVEAVCRREWPKGTEVRLLAVVDTVMAVTPESSQFSVVKWIETSDEENWDEVRKIFQPLADKLKSSGLDAAVMIRRGNPTNELLDEAESWGADCIFLGPKGTRGIDRLLLGSVSAAVSARADCSVEIVRS